MASSKGRRRRREGVAALPVTITDAALARRRKRSRQRRRLWRRLAVLGTALLLAVVITWLVAFSPVLAAKRVQVSGVQVLSAPSVTQAAAVPLGRPLARIDTATIAQRVAALPQVEKVHVNRAWPHTVTIAVTERTPVLQRRDAGTWHWVDATGRSFHQTPEPKAKLVVVEAPADQRILRDCATVSASLSPKLRQALHKMSATSPDTITLHLSGGRTVIWGSAAESDTKSQVATALLGVKATVFDVSSPANPTSR
ncbi:FtsQ-type POTRA domain-containing protein [Aestuariimicrobium sp. p3-SID1156]|uniref:cell division protein FtsQ/DivIB n=1 Tax=Aestuariimicrobium sp. p3-SID1156 TaxID=2916038 RepID=UPI00223B7734|nr:FtsQ-type POTRA domain-containing protein [Aestuariimicrobium sp. p3-SID1156]MCT1458910.1 FtsQ-type POTRA domain-containing protein [Aestuariimicrobium sp. p3-SID1156]